MPVPTLAELQRGFFESIAAHPGAGAATFDPAVVAVIEPSPRLGSAARLDIYADMYFARLKDCLAEDFSRTVELLGPAAWDRLARGYFAAHRSRHPSVRHAGARMAAYLSALPAAEVPAAIDSTSSTQPTPPR
jgi:Putative DNA-binding domain